MFSVLRKTKKLNLPIDLQLQMFDCMVVPCLLYGSEIFGYEKSYIIESLFLQFHKIIMSLKRARLMLSHMVNWVVTLQIF